MKKIILIMLPVMLLLTDCYRDKINPASCGEDILSGVVTERNFKLGFSTWSFGPGEADRDETYKFISLNSDIYSEQIDDKIPWSSWINKTSLPTEFIDDIEFRVSRKLSSHKLLLSVSLLNTNRDDLLEDYDGTIPSYKSLNDRAIEEAYFKHLEYLINRFNPDYLVTAMEINDLKSKSGIKWNEYKLLMKNIRFRLKKNYPALPISESVTLHNWFNPEVKNPSEYIAEIGGYINQNLDFAAISFFPFLRDRHTRGEFQEEFDFLHSEVKIPISFVETAHLAESLEISSFNLSIKGDFAEQKIYLETLFLNACNQDYIFVIWWAHRDFDKLWATFPPEIKDIGKLWRDTGLLDENGGKRPAYRVWKQILDR